MAIWRCDDSIRDYESRTLSGRALSGVVVLGDVGLWWWVDGLEGWRRRVPVMAPWSLIFDQQNPSAVSDVPEPVHTTPPSIKRGGNGVGVGVVNDERIRDRMRLID